MREPLALTASAVALSPIGEIPVASFELAIVEEYQDKGNGN